MNCLPTDHCLQLTMDFIRSLGHWGQDAEAEPLLPPVERDFPPPDTILTAPKRRPQPLGHSVVRSSSSSLGPAAAGQSPSIARESLDRIKRSNTISSTFSGRMRPLRISQPPTPTTAQSRHFPTAHRTTSSLSTPLPRSRMPVPPFLPPAPRTYHPEDSPQEGAKTFPLPTPESTTPRPQFPVPMARSISEPQGLSDLSGFAPHQMARGRSGGVSVNRGRSNRPRAATGSGSAVIAERLAGLPVPIGFAETYRGRSPGPRIGGLSGRPSPLGSTTDLRPLLPARSVSNGLISPTPDVPTDVDQDSNDGELVPSNAGAQEEGVVRRDLGIQGLFTGRRGRGRGRPGRGRAITH